MSDAATPADGPPPLRTEPRPAVVHWLVDSAAIFLALLIAGLIVGVAWWAILIAALLLGFVAAHYTRQADVRAMAERHGAAPRHPELGSQ